MIAFFDLEGPLCPIDHAAEAMALIGQKLEQKVDFYQLFKMISLYDDHLFLVEKKKDYWPGDTLKLIAPIVTSYLSEKELLTISREAALTPGAKELFDYLHKEDIPTYIISTSYTHHAHTIAKKLAHPVENVRCTTLDYTFQPSTGEAVLQKLFDEIFPKYLDKGLKAIKKDLDKFFFQTIPNSSLGKIFATTVVCGGLRKKTAVREILDQHNLTTKKAIAIGDSITDIQMLTYIRENEGVAISFNGNKHSLEAATIAFSAHSISPLKKIFQHHPDSISYIKKLSPEKKHELANQEIYYDIIDTSNPVEFQQILTRQLRFRKKIRVKAADLT
ncbi:MAG: HAD hydrolase family protein [Asgard group archaeon]|nr:HAD hydrolase family protein [Asgard group archaeon]